jgi:plasmid maintenance system antidote protein VapI
MDKCQMTEAIIAAKLTKSLTWEQIAERIGMSPVWTTSACMGQNSMPEQHADRLCSVMDLAPEVSAALQEFPHKTWDKTVPTREGHHERQVPAAQELVAGHCARRSTHRSGNLRHLARGGQAMAACLLHRVALYRRGKALSVRF